MSYTDICEECSSSEIFIYLSPKKNFENDGGIYDSTVNTPHSEWKITTCIACGYVIDVVEFFD